MAEQNSNKHLTLVLKKDTYNAISEDAKSRGLALATRIRQLMEIYSYSISSDIALLKLLLDDNAISDNNSNKIYENIIKDAEENCLPVNIRVKQILKLYYSGKLVENNNTNNNAGNNNNSDDINNYDSISTKIELDLQEEKEHYNSKINNNNEDINYNNIKDVNEDNEDNNIKDINNIKNIEEQENTYNQNDININNKNIKYYNKSNEDNNYNNIFKDLLEENKLNSNSNIIDDMDISTNDDINDNDDGFLQPTNITVGFKKKGKIIKDF